MSVTVSVPEAAVLLGVSERTVWRRIKEGLVSSRRVGRQVLVLVDQPPRTRIAEAAIAYVTDAEVGVDPLVGPWPFTASKVAAFRERERQRRRQAVEELRLLAAETRPDPHGLTVVDYLRSWRDPDAEDEDAAEP